MKKYIDNLGKEITEEEYYQRDENGECVIFEAYEIDIEKINGWTYDISVNDIYLRLAMVVDEETQTYQYGDIALIQPTAQELNDFILEMHEREN